MATINSDSHEKKSSIVGARKNCVLPGMKMPFFTFLLKRSSSGWHLIPFLPHLIFNEEEDESFVFINRLNGNEMSGRSESFVLFSSFSCLASHKNVKLINFLNPMGILLRIKILMKSFRIIFHDRHWVTYGLTVINDFLIKIPQSFDISNQ